MLIGSGKKRTYNFTYRRRRLLLDADATTNDVRCYSHTGYTVVWRVGLLRLRRLKHIIITALYAVAEPKSSRGANEHAEYLFVFLTKK